MLFSTLLALFLGSAVYGEVLNDFYMDTQVDADKRTLKTEPNLINDPDTLIKHGNFGQPNVDSLLSNATFINALKTMPDELRRLVIKGLISEMSPREKSKVSNDDKDTSISLVDDNNTTVLPTEQLLSTTTDTASFNKCTKQFSCLNCTTARICAPSPVTYEMKEIARVHCSEDKPYCDEATGSCVASVETALKCAAPSSDFICLKDGYFPHPNDCAKYYLCMDFKPYEFKCKQDYYYNAKSQACDLYYYSSNCYSFPCKGQNGVKVPYSFDSTFYAYCIGHKPFVISRCEGAYKMNATSQKCEPVCAHNGLYEDVTDCTAYFKCVKNGLSYKRTRHMCPDDQGFEPSAFQCIPLIETTGCRPQLDKKN